MIPSVVILLFYILLEGGREYYYYILNRAAKFALPKQDSYLKVINASLFLLVIYLCGINTLLFGLSLRWIIIDGFVNLSANRAFFYVTNSKRSVVDRVSFWINKYIPIPIIKIVGLTISLFFL